VTDPEKTSALHWQRRSIGDVAEAQGWNQTKPIVACSTISGVPRISWKLASAVKGAKFLFGLLEDFFLAGLEVAAGTIDGEDEHRHGGAEGWGLATGAGLG
jgi:hypothetical protein